MKAKEVGFELRLQCHTLSEAYKFRNILKGFLKSLWENDKILIGKDITGESHLMKTTLMLTEKVRFKKFMDLGNKEIFKEK